MTPEEERAIDAQADAEWVQCEKDGTCFQCGTKLTIDTAGDRVCPLCGYSPEWAALDEK